MKEGFIVNSESSKVAYHATVDAMYAEHPYLTFAPPRVGIDRSLDQNALFHLWCTECAAHYLNKGKKQITEGELEGMKRQVKRECLVDNPDYGFMRLVLVNPKTGITKVDYTSSSSWKVGEMFSVLSWLQMKVAFDGIVLESKGEFLKNQKGAVA